MPQASRGLEPPYAAIALMAGVVVASGGGLVVRGGFFVLFEVVALLMLTAAGVIAWRSWRLARDAAEHSLRCEARQRAIVDSAGEAVIVIDERAAIIEINRAAERMFGYSAAEMRGESLERLMTEGGRRAHAAYMAQTGVTAMVEAARLRSIHQGVRKSGEVFSFELVMTEWSDQGRRMFTGVMRDVTNRERTADALREVQARFVSLFENSPDPLFICELAGDGGFVLEAMNQNAEAYTGLSRFTALGCRPDELGTAESAREIKRALLQALSTAEPVEQTLQLRSKTGPRPVPMRFSPMRDGSGEIRRVLASARVLPAPLPKLNPVLTA